MKTTCWVALGVGLAAALAASAAAQSAVASPTVSGPFKHRNLAVYLIHGKDAVPGKNFLTLQEALEAKKIVVHETGSVGQLAVENLSADEEVFIQAGDIVKGGQQDRVLAYDLVVSARSGKVPIASFCVEHGRWSRRGTEDAGRFSQSTGQLPGRALRLAVRSDRDQGQVWDKVREQQDKLARRLSKDVTDPRSRSSLQLTLENPDLQAKVDRYVAALEQCISTKREGGKGPDKGDASQSDVIGVVFAINGRIESAETYGAADLMRRIWPKLLRTAAIDAFTEHQPGRRYEPAEADEVAAFLAEGAQGKGTDKEVSRRIVVTTREGPTALSMETRDRGHKDAVLHHSYIAR